MTEEDSEQRHSPTLPTNTPTILIIVRETELVWFIRRSSVHSKSFLTLCLPIEGEEREESVKSQLNNFSYQLSVKWSLYLNIISGIAVHHPALLRTFEKNQLFSPPVLNDKIFVKLIG